MVIVENKSLYRHEGYIKIFVSLSCSPHMVTLCTETASTCYWMYCAKFCSNWLKITQWWKKNNDSSYTVSCAQGWATRLFSFYYASISSLSLGASFWYVFSISVLLLLKSIVVLQCMCNITPGRSDMREVEKKHNTEQIVYVYMRLITCYNIALSSAVQLHYIYIIYFVTDWCLH